MNNIPQPINVSGDAYRVWHEEAQVANEFYRQLTLRMDANFFERQLFGVISVWAMLTGYPSGLMMKMNASSDMKRIALITVDDTDYRATIKAAQEAWATQQQEWTLKAIEFLGGEHVD
jgi:hypothetical protein